MSKKSNSAEVRRQHEHEVFSGFANAARFVVTDLAQPDPPAPDILCTCANGAQIAFELVRIDDQDFRERLSLWARMWHLVKDAVATLPAATRQQLEDRLGDALVWIDFVGCGENDTREQRTLLIKQRQTLMPEVADLLLQVGRGHVGNVAIPRTLQSTIRAVEIRRRRFSAPILDVAPLMSMFSDPIHAALASKAGKAHKYTVRCPLHLLAYYDAQPPAASNQGYVRMEFERARAMPGLGRFEKIWIFNPWQDEIIAEFLSDAGATVTDAVNTRNTDS